MASAVTNINSVLGSMPDDIEKGGKLSFSLAAVYYSGNIRWGKLKSIKPTCNFIYK